MTPIPESQDVLQRDGVPDNIKSFYKFNHIWRFRYDRPFHKGAKDKENEFKVRTLKSRKSLKGRFGVASRKTRLHPEDAGSIGVLERDAGFLKEPFIKKDVLKLAC